MTLTWDLGQPFDFWHISPYYISLLFDFRDIPRVLSAQCDRRSLLINTDHWTLFTAVASEAYYNHLMFVNNT